MCSSNPGGNIADEYHPEYEDVFPRISVAVPREESVLKDLDGCRGRWRVHGEMGLVNRVSRHRWAEEDRIRAEEGHEKEKGEIEETKRGGSSARYRGGEVEVGGYQREELKERFERENETQDRTQAELEQEL